MNKKEQEKIIFEKTLKGEPIMTDVFNRPIMLGDFIAYSVMDYRRATMKIGKVIDVVEKEDYAGKAVKKAKVIRIEKSVLSKQKKHWEKGSKPSYLEKSDNIIKIDNVPAEVVTLLEEIEKEL